MLSFKYKAILIHIIYNQDLITNTMLYDVEFEDGNVKQYAATIIATN